jgi:hypothetical protein
MYFLPTCLCIFGIAWLIGSYFLAAETSSVTLAHVDWPEVANCTVLEIRRGSVFSGVPVSRQTNTSACAKQSTECTPLCVVRVECPVVKANSTGEFETLVAMSTNELFPGISESSAPALCSGSTNASSHSPVIKILRNPHTLQNDNTFTSLYECLVEDFGCCSECSELDSPTQIRGLESTLRMQIFGISMGLGLAMIVAGAVMLIVIVYFAQIGPFRERARLRARLQNPPDFRRRDREEHENAADDINLDMNDRRGGQPNADNAAPLPSAPAARSGRRRHRSRRRDQDRRNNAEPQQPHVAIEPFDDDFDTSPSAAAAPVAVTCKGCAAPIDANTLACIRCGKVSEERLERAAFEFGGGELERQCTVCLDDIESGTRVVTLPCAHLYHIDCIAAWLDKKNVCPQCLTVVK